MAFTSIYFETDDGYKKTFNEIELHTPTTDLNLDDLRHLKQDETISIDLSSHFPTSLSPVIKDYIISGKTNAYNPTTCNTTIYYHLKTPPNSIKLRTEFEIIEANMTEIIDKKRKHIAADDAYKELINQLLGKQEENTINSCLKKYNG